MIGCLPPITLITITPRAPQFAAFFIAPNRDKVLKMVQMAAYRVPNCDGMLNKSGCYDLVPFLSPFPDHFSRFVRFRN